MSIIFDYLKRPEDYEDAAAIIDLPETMMIAQRTLKTLDAFTETQDAQIGIGLLLYSAATYAVEWKPENVKDKESFNNVLFGIFPEEAMKDETRFAVAFCADKLKGDIDAGKLYYIRKIEQNTTAARNKETEDFNL